MKKKLLLLVLLCFLNSYAQFNTSAPWMQGIEEAKNGEATIDQLKESFDAYWSNHDKTKRGSGYKPFMRWEYHWSNKVNDQGYLIKPQEMWDAWAQKNQAKLQRSANVVSLPVSNWQPVGPYSHTNTGSWSSGQGRVNIVAVDPLNSNIVYLGAPAGGIWKSTDAGITWAPLSDYLPQIGVSGIAIDHTNTNIIYIATGDKDASDTYSVGVMKSIDGGITWNTTGLVFNNTSSNCGDIIMHPSNNQILFCATDDGIYKTSDAGNTWSLVQSGDFAQGNIRFKPGNPSVVYGVTNNSFYRSTNTGNNFTQITTGLPATSGRLVMDVTPANSEVIYILSTLTNWGFQGVYKSTNGGTSFTKTANNTDVLESTQGWFDLALAVSNTNENEIYTGCLNVWKSTNGGGFFTKLNSWSNPSQATYTHADIHFLGFLNGKLYCGSDGGIYVSDNNGISFTDLTAGAQIGQFYKIAVSKQSASKMVGGLQDNGGYAYSNNSWKNYYGADGMDTAISPVNSNLYYGFIQGGSGLYISNNAGNSLGSSVGAPTEDGGNWVTPLISNSLGEIYSGFNGLYKLVGSSWELQNTNSVGSGTLELITVDPSNDNNMYVTNGSNLYKSTDKGLTFTLVYNAFNTIAAIEVHSSNSNIIYIVTSGTNGQVRKSIDGGNTFTNMSSGLPAIGKNTIVHQGRHSDNPLYLGTSLGVYYIDDTMISWEPFDTNLPNVSVTDLEINLNDKKLIASTYGRGIWQTDIPTQLANNDVVLKSIQYPGIDINCNSSFEPQLEIENNGLNPINTIDITYSFNNLGNSNYTWTGSIPSASTQIITLPLQSLPRGSYSMTVNTTIANDAYADNNTLEHFFLVNDSGALNQVNPFTNISDALISYNEGESGSQWIRGSRNSGLLGTGTNVVYATNLFQEYPDNKKSYLVSQCFDLSTATNPQINFKLQYDLENNWDIVYVEYSTNFGQSWTVLGEMGPNWYNSDRTPETSGNDCNNCPGAQWTGTNTAFNTYFYPLNALIGQANVIFRIVFHSDQNVTALGANVDDFVITGVLSNQNFELQNIAIYPNPSKGIFNISLGDLKPSLIEVYDISGKTILFKKDIQTSNFETSFDLSNASTGIYFIKLTAYNQSIVKRIVKE